MSFACWSSGATGIGRRGNCGSAGASATNLSFHLKALTQSGLLVVVQEGRFQRYRANMALMTDLIGYLTDECCGGNPGACLPGRAAADGIDCD